MQARLFITAPDLTEVALQQLTRDLTLTLNRETEVEAEIAEEPGGSGSKGDMGLIGQIVLTVLGSGGVAVALIGVLRSYVERSTSLTIEFTREDGRKLKIEGDDLTPERIVQIQEAARKFFEE